MIAPSEPQWYVARDGKRFGPMSDADFRKLAAEGQLVEDDYVWREGFDDWVYARNVPGLLPAQSVTDQPNTPSQSQAQSMPDLSMDQAMFEPTIDPQLHQPDQAYAPAPAQQTAPSFDPIANQPHMAPEPQFDQQPVDSNWAQYGQQHPEPQFESPAPEQSWQTAPEPNWPHHQTMAQPTHAAPVANQSSIHVPMDASMGHDSSIRGLDHHEPTFSNEFEMTADMPLEKQSRRSGGGLKKIAFTVAIVLFLVVIAGVALPFVVPADAIRNQVVKIIKEKTGRDVIIRGRTSVAFFPNIGVKLSDITIANPQGMAGEPMLRMAALTVDLKLLPLIMQQVKLERFVLKNPRLSLIVDNEGRKNWVFDQTNSPNQNIGTGKPNDNGSGFETVIHAAKPTSSDQPFRVAQLNPVPQPTNSPAAPASSLLQSLSLGDVRIVDGTVTYEDLRTASSQKVDSINVLVSMKSVNEPLSVDGQVNWRGETVNIKANLEEPDKYLNNGPSPLQFSLESSPLNAKFNGKLANPNAPSLNGEMTANAASFARLVKWTADTQVLDNSDEPFSLKGTVFANAEKILLNKTNITHGSTTATGDTAVNLTGTRPSVQASLSVNHLNINKYMLAPGQSRPSPAKPKKTAAVKAPPPPPAEPQSLTALIQQVNLDGEGETGSDQSAATSAQSSGNLSGLGAVDADIFFTTEKLTYKDISTDRTVVKVNLAGGKLVADLQEAKLYGGSAVGQFKIDSTSPGNPFKSTWKATSVSALPFLKDAAKLDWVSGKANITLDVSGSGEEHTQIMKSLSGNGSVVFQDGAIEGINIPGMIRNVQNGNLSGLSRTSSEKTDFSQFSGTFEILNGVATNKDLTLVSPLLRINGAGSANLASETLDYRVQPKIVASLEGQGAKATAVDGIAIPVHLKGPWKNPQILPDAGALLKNPNNLVEGAKKIGKLFKSKKKISGKDFESIINNVLAPGKTAKPAANGATQPATSQAPQENKQIQAIETNKLLKQLLSQ